MIKSLSMAFIVALAVLAPAVLGLVLLTRHTTMLSPRAVTEAQQALSAPAEDGGLGDPAATATDPSATLETMRHEAAKTAFLWLVETSGAAFVVAAVWLVAAERIGRAVTGSGGQSSASNAWYGLALVLAVAAGTATYVALHGHRYAAAVAAGTLQGSFLLIGLTAVLTYYLGTAIAVPRLMRPSVPLATLWLR